MTVTASSKKYLGHREMILTRLPGEKCVKMMMMMMMMI